MLKKSISSLVFCFIISTIFGQPWEEHGDLKVSSNGHYLEHEDGTGFFWLGCTAWKLPSIKPNDVDRYLQDRANKKFNVIQFVATNMGNHNFEKEMPFIGEGRPYSEMKPNEKYWKHVDYIVEKAKEKKLYVAIFVWWGHGADDQKKDGTPGPRQFFTNPDVHNYEFGKFLGERYKQQPNIIWVGAGEYHKNSGKMFPNGQSPMSEQHSRRLLKVVEGIKETNTGNHLYTIHPISFISSSEEYHHNDLFDFNMIQSHAIPGFILPLTYADWNKQPAKPSFNAEGWYENEHRLYAMWTKMDRIDNKENDPSWKQRYQAYWSVFAGGFGFTYGHKNIWRMEDSVGNRNNLQQTYLDVKSTRELQYLRSLIESKPIQTRIPDLELVSSASRGRDFGLLPDLRIGTRSEDGKWAFIYITRGSLVRIVMSRLANGKTKAYWYNPRNGMWYHEKEAESFEKRSFEIDIPSGDDAPDKYFNPPGKPEDSNDWVLVLEAE